jgi:hypothetical protein
MAEDTTRGMLARLLGTSSTETLDPTNPDLDRAFKVLTAKLPEYNDLWNYYDGDQPLMYASRRLRDIFQDLDLATFVENWCSVVIDAANDRIELSGVTVEGMNQDDVDKLLQEIELSVEADDTHEAALVIGESYVIVGEAEESPGVDLFYNDPRLVHLFYDPGNPKKKWYGAKWWVAGDNHIRMTLYYADKIQYYRSNKEAKSVSSSKAFMPYSPDGTESGAEIENKWGKVPVFHFRLERRKVKGDLVNVIPMQNGINKLLTDMLVAAEFGAFRQRWIIGNVDPGNLKNAPNEVWYVPGGDGVGQQSSVGEFNPTDLKNYIQTIDHLASSAAIISRTPKHYLFQQGGDPSGEALIAMEAPLNKRCNDHIERFTSTWKEVIQFVLMVVGKEVEKGDISVNFNKPETIQPKTEAEIRKSGRDAGIPLKTLLRDEGKSDAWIAQMEEDLAEAKKGEASNLGVALANAIREANRPETAPTEQPTAGNENAPDEQ